MTNQKQYNSEIKIPENISIKLQNNLLFFSGPLGSTVLNLTKIDPLGSSGLKIDKNSNTLTLITATKSFHGLLTSLIQNKIQGMSRGFLIYLKIVGIGYRAHLEKNNLFLKLGYSHDILYKIPSSIKIFLLDPTLICLFGIDKNQVTQIAAKLRDLRKPSVYKGKGIRLLDEKIFLKTGKRK
jgi:large subunit ribosomal protein L6